MFETHRRWQYVRELLFSIVVELMTLVILGLRPSLYATARQSGNLPVSLTALYDKVRGADRRLDLTPARPPFAAGTVCFGTLSAPLPRI